MAEVEPQSAASAADNVPAQDSTIPEAANSNTSSLQQTPHGVHEVSDVVGAENTADEIPAEDSLPADDTANDKTNGSAPPQSEDTAVMDAASPPSEDKAEQDTTKNAGAAGKSKPAMTVKTAGGGKSNGPATPLVKKVCISC